MSLSAFWKLASGGFVVFFLCLSAVGYERIEVDGTEFVWRKPSGTPAENGVLVLFGGRNWPGEKTLTTFGFEAVADRCGVVLVSPSFRTGEYWNPKKTHTAGTPNTKESFATKEQRNCKVVKW